jgi:lipase
LSRALARSAILIKGSYLDALQHSLHPGDTMRNDSLIEHRLSADAGDLCWFEWGSKGAQPSLLLLHATGFHARCWDQVVAYLSPNIHVVAVDVRGHGGSYRPASLSNWMDAADDIVALVDELFDSPVFIAGHSMGGVLAARIAAFRPEAVSSLLLIDPVVVSPDVYQAMAGRPPADPSEHPVSRRRNVWESAEQMAAHFAERVPYASWDRRVLDDYCRYGLLPAEDGSLELACPPALEASAYLGAGYSSPYDWLEGVKAPATVLRGRNGERASSMDFSISPTNPALASLLPNGTDMQWPEHSHFIPMEAPERTADLIAALL